MKRLLLLLLLLPIDAHSATLKLKWTNPTQNADTLNCLLPDTLSPLYDLKSMRVKGVRFGSLDTLLLGDIPVTQPGVRDSADFTIADGTMGELIFYSVDESGNVSCRGSHYLFAFPPIETAPPPTATNNGLLGTYYTYDRWNDFKQLLGSRVDSMINFDWGAGAGWSAGPADYWSVKWTGKIGVPLDGNWILYIVSNDGSRLWIDGVQVQNNWTDKSSETSCSIQLSAGLHDIRLEYYEGYSSARCVLFWSGPSTPKQVVPSSALFVE